MAISKEKKNEIIAQYARHEGDTGSVEVQVAVLTWEINHLNEHIKQHKKTTLLTVVLMKKSVTVVTCWHTFAAQTLTVTVS